MPEGVGYSGSNVVVNTGLELNYIGAHCYAYSGQKVATGGGDATLLSFTTGAQTIVGELCFTENERGSNAIELQGFINGIRMLDYEYDASPMDTRIVYPLLFPPYTVFEFRFIAQGSNINGTAWFVGRVYE